MPTVLIDFSPLRRPDAIGELVNEDIVAILECRHHARTADEKRLDKKRPDDKNSANRDYRDLENLKERNKKFSHGRQLERVMDIL